jgi:SET domain-containing protein
MVKKSSLPNAGNGLFVKIDFKKGEMITEYKGRRRTWAQVENDADNGYIFHIDDDNVIDAQKNVNTFGRYANDAAGLHRVSGLRNNAEYIEESNRVFIRATRNIKAGNEVFVSYGKRYWKQVRDNMKDD